jgi:hypothetical protein
MRAPCMSDRWPWQKFGCLPRLRSRPRAGGSRRRPPHQSVRQGRRPPLHTSTYGVGGTGILDLAGVYVLATADDHVLAPVRCCSSPRRRITPGHRCASSPPRRSLRRWRAGSSSSRA